jgi:hypothetical protein
MRQWSVASGQIDDRRLWNSTQRGVENAPGYDAPNANGASMEGLRLSPTASPHKR